MIDCGIEVLLFLWLRICEKNPDICLLGRCSSFQLFWAEVLNLIRSSLELLFSGTYPMNLKHE
jgi:hypothetical protein